MGECKSELVEILDVKDSVEGAVQHLETALDESKEEKPDLVDSKKRLSIELEERMKQLTNKCEQHDVLEEKIECVSQQSGAGRKLSSSTSSSHYASQRGCVIAKSKEEGNLFLD